LRTISPQPHDIPMDFVVTEAGLHAVIDERLTRVDAQGGCAHAQRICDQRGLPRRRVRENSAYSSPVCYAAEFPGYFGATDNKSDEA
jgi:hypothetical protein